MDGTPFWNRISITPVKNETGVTTHFIGIQSDITKRRSAEIAFEKANKHLEAAIFGHTYEAGDSPGKSPAGLRIRPARKNFLTANFLKGHPHSIFEWYQPDIQLLVQIIFPADNFHFHAVNQVYGQLV